MVTNVKYAGVCNKCGRRSEYYVAAGSRSLQLCGTCLSTLCNEARKLLVVDSAKEPEPYDNGKETGLIRG